MKKLRVPIFTEEYAIVVYIGKRDEIRKAAEKYLGRPIKEFEEKHRGMAFNALPDNHPLIVLDGLLPAHIALATLAHEASHSMDDISDFINLHHTEFHAHGIGAVMRVVGKCLNLDKKK